MKIFDDDCCCCCCCIVDEDDNAEREEERCVRYSNRQAVSHHAGRGLGFATTAYTARATVARALLVE